MIFYGLEKLSLVDFDGHTAATVFTGGCNFRCSYCHNSMLVTGIDELREFTETEVLGYLTRRKGLLDGVCITGGEPTLAPDLSAFCEKAKAIRYLVKLDTNGSRPKVLKDLVEKNLIDYVAMDVKNSPEKYSATVGVENVRTDKIIESINFLLENRVPYEFRTTVTKELHTAEDFKKIGRLVSGAEKYIIQKFSASGNCLVPGGNSEVPKKTAEQFLAALSPYVKRAELRGY